MADTPVKPPQEEKIVPPAQGSQEQTPAIKPVTPPPAPVVAPVTPPLVEPSTPTVVELSNADLLFELDNRGFKSKEEAERLIKRFDNAVLEKELAEQRLTELLEEQKRLEVRFTAREKELEIKAKKMLDARAEQDSRLSQINDRIALLTKLES